MKKAKLYIVPTPIGNLGDMTLRGIEILKQVSLIGAEDTRTSRKLLDKYLINTPMISYHKFNEKRRADHLIRELQEGNDIAIISDAGTPGISDPSLILIDLAIAEEIPVEILPGATSLIPALLQSGLYQKGFYFCGYLPEKQKLRNTELGKLKYIEAPLIFFLGPHDLSDFLTIIREILGDRKIAISREISKIHESIYRNRISFFQENAEMIVPKGEFVIVIDGFVETVIEEKTVEELLKIHFKAGISSKEAVKLVHRESGVSRNKIYQIALNLKKQ